MCSDDRIDSLESRIINRFDSLDRRIDKLYEQQKITNGTVARHDEFISGLQKVIYPVLGGIIGAIILTVLTAIQQIT